MRASVKGVIIVLVIGMGLFGYSQYASASQIGITITQSHLLEENEKAQCMMLSWNLVIPHC